MSFTTNTPQPYKVKFHHHDRGTDCVIGVVQPSLNDTKPVFVPLYYGAAYLNPKDSPNKNIGRKVALSKALSAIERDKRKAFWDAYFVMRNGKF